MLKILIIEDEDIIRRGLVYTIDWTAMGCRVVGDAADGVSGLALIEREHPDIVLTDIIMPGMNGLSMVAAAKELPAPSFKTILLTSYPEFDYARRALQLGASAYLLKPVDEKELAEAIRKIQLQTKAELEAHPLPSQHENALLIDWSDYLNENNLRNSYVAQALYRIRDHYDEKLSIDSLADELAISTSYLSRKFKEATAHTFVELLSKYRIQKAIHLLEKGTYRVYEVSELTGFSDYKNFCVVFKKYMGHSPKEYMKRSTANEDATSV